MTAPKTVLVLRTSDANHRGYGGFQWPLAGPVEAPDWSPEAQCGNGLHGLLKGVGDISHLKHIDASRVWQVVEVVESDIVDIDGDKVKFPRGNVIYSGTCNEAVALVQARHPEVSCAFATATAGYAGTATAGERGTATAGDAGTATAGDRGTATAGDAGEIRIRWWDGKRYRTAVGYIGEDGLLACKAYKFDGKTFVVA